MIRGMKMTKKGGMMLESLRERLADYIAPKNTKDADEYRKIATGFYTGGKVSQSDYHGMIDKYKKWIYAAVRTISADIASAELQLFQRTGKDRNEEVKKHDFLTLWKNPNPEVTKRFLHRLQSIFYELTGQAYWYFILDGFNKPVEVWSIMPTNIKPRKNKNGTIRDYEFRPKQTGKPVYIPKEQILHEKEPNPMNFTMGYSPIYAANDPIHLMDKMGIYHDRLFQRMARPDVILWNANGDNIGISARKRIEESWKNAYGGVENAGRPAVLEGGLKAEPFSTTPKDLEYAEGYDRVLGEIVACYGVTLDKLGLTRDVNKANAYALDLTYQRNTIKPKLQDKANWWEQFVLHRYFKNTEDMYCAFKSNIPEDKEMEIKENTQYVINGILSRNRVREKIGEPPVKGADELLIPMNMTGSGSAVVGQGRPTTAPVAAPPKEIIKLLTTKTQRLAYWKRYANRRQLYEEQYRYALLKIFKKLEKQTVSIINDLYKKGLKGVEWLTPPEQAFKDEIEGVSKLFVKQAVVIGGNNITVDFDLPISFEVDPDMLKMYLGERVNLIHKATDQTYTHLKKILQDGVDGDLSVSEMAAKIHAEFPKFSKFQSNRISITELNSAENKGHIMAMVQANVGSKMWITAGDEDVRESHVLMDGETVLLADVFSNGLEHPCEPHCRCAVAPA